MSFRKDKIPKFGRIVIRRIGRDVKQDGSIRSIGRRPPDLPRRPALLDQFGAFQGVMDVLNAIELGYDGALIKCVEASVLLTRPGADRRLEAGPFHRGMYECYRDDTGTRIVFARRKIDGKMSRWIVERVIEMAGVARRLAEAARMPGKRVIGIVRSVRITARQHSHVYTQNEQNGRNDLQHEGNQRLTRARPIVLVSVPNQITPDDGS